MTLSNRGWKRPTPTVPAFPNSSIRAPRRSRAFTPGRTVILLGLLVVIVLMLPRHMRIGGYHVRPGFAPYLAPYIFG